MPYIPNESVQEIDFGKQPINAGELNYKITQLIVNYLPEIPCYQDYNEVVGVLECAKMELYRRVIAQYEERKIEDPENIDPYEDLEEIIFGS